MRHAFSSMRNIGGHVDDALAVVKRLQGGSAAGRRRERGRWRGRCGAARARTAGAGGGRLGVGAAKAGGAR